MALCLQSSLLISTLSSCLGSQTQALAREQESRELARHAATAQVHAVNDKYATLRRINLALESRIMELQAAVATLPLPGQPSSLATLTELQRASAKT